MTPSARKSQPERLGAKAPGTARWLNMVTTIVLGAAVLIVAASAVPSLIHAAIGAAGEPQDFPPPVRSEHPTLIPRDHPSPRGFTFAPDDDADQDEQDIDSPPGTRRAPGPNDPRVKPPRIPGSDDLDLGLKNGVTVRPLRLRDRRTDSVVDEVRAGERIHILREDGEWVLIVKGDATDLVTGWAHRKDLQLR